MPKNAFEPLKKVVEGLLGEELLNTINNCFSDMEIAEDEIRLAMLRT